MSLPSANVYRHHGMLLAAYAGNLSTCTLHMPPYHLTTCTTMLLQWQHSSMSEKLPNTLPTAARTSYSQQPQARYMATVYS